MFEYDCKYCDTEMEGDFGEDVYCPKCDITYETEFELNGSDEGYGYFAWLTTEHKGKNNE